MPVHLFNLHTLLTNTTDPSNPFWVKGKQRKGANKRPTLMVMDNASKARTDSLMARFNNITEARYEVDERWEMERQVRQNVSVPFFTAIDRSMQ